MSVKNKFSNWHPSVGTVKSAFVAALIFIVVGFWLLGTLYYVGMGELTTFQNMALAILSLSTAFIGLLLTAILMALFENGGK